MLTNFTRIVNANKSLPVCVLGSVMFSMTRYDTFPIVLYSKLKT